MITALGQPSPHEQATAAVLASLPTPDYPRNYQPDYPNQQTLREGVHELHETEGVTTPRQVDAVQAKLTLLATDKIHEPIIVTGRCAEEVNLTTPIDVLVDQALTSQQIVLSALGKAIHFLRNRGQTTKPRSAALELLADGRRVPPFMGGAVNGPDPEHRTPDPSRMVASAVQSRDLEAGLQERGVGHIPAAHEALLLPYERSFVRVDPETGKKYLLSADMPWIGKRTNALTSEHVAMLAEVENPIGIKIGADSTPEHIAGLHAILNPRDIPGKLVFMLRVGPENAGQLSTVLHAIKAHSPQSIIMYDVHGVTRTAATGEKIRAVPEIIADIKAMATACRATGLKLHGLHLETTTDDSRLECVDRSDQLPTHPGGVDPQLNPRQTKYVLEQTKQYLL